MTSRRVFIAGHNGMVGSALVKRFEKESDVDLILRSRDDLDLTSQEDVANFFADNKIDEVYLAAAKVGGIYANNNYPAEFIYQNTIIECNIIHAAHLANVRKLLFLGSSCIYPRLTSQPIKEAALLTGELEPTNEPYAIAKILGIKLCESYNRQYGRDYRSVMPTNLYGPHDNFHPENSHVIPALIRRFHKNVRSGSESIVIWGTGNPKREFLHVDDLAEACLFVMNLEQKELRSVTSDVCSHLNVGTGIDCSIKELAEIIALATGFCGEIKYNKNKPDGPPQKLLDTTKLNSLGWNSKMDLVDGIKHTYSWYLENESSDELRK